MAELKPNETGNRLLDSLPAGELRRLQPLWEVVSFEQAEEIYRQGGPLSHVYFPLSGLYATLVRLEDGRAVEASTVGSEGMMGLAAVLGLDFSPKTATTPVAGTCLSLSIEEFQRAATPGGSLDRILRRYAAFALRNAYQTVVCNAVHSAQERLCRWLLTNQDRLGNDGIALTHELLADLLGVRRQTVTVITGTLQSVGLVTSRRGHVQILDRQKLEAAACECYRSAKTLYTQIVGGPVVN